MVFLTAEMTFPLHGFAIARPPRFPELRPSREMRRTVSAAETSMLQGG